MKTTCNEDGIGGLYTSKRKTGIRSAVKRFMFGLSTFLSLTVTVSILFETIETIQVDLSEIQKSG